MATREYYTVAATGEATTTATAFANAATLSFTPSDNQSYALFWSLNGSHSDTTTDLQVRLLNQTTTATLADVNREANDTAEKIAFGGISFATFATATGTSSFALQYGNETATTQSNVRDAFITALKLNTADQFRESISTVTTTATAAFQTVATFSFTPSATGNYYILSSADLLTSTGSIMANIRLQGGGTATHYGSASLCYKDNTSWRPWAGVANLALTTSQWDFSIDVLGATTSLTKTRNHRFLALRSDGFDSLDFDDAGQIFSTTTSSATAASVTATTSARDYLVVAACEANTGGSPTNTHIELWEDSTEVSDGVVDSNNSNADDPIFVSYKRTFTAAAHTIHWGVYGDAASNFWRCRNSNIAIIDLEGAAAAAGTSIPQFMRYYRNLRVA